MELNNNNLVGGLPPELGNLGVGEYLDFAHNSRLAGPIPLTFADLDLETFYSTKTDICVPPSLKDWFDRIPRTDNPTACSSGDG